MESAGGTESAQTGAQIQMLGVAQDDLGADILLQLLMIHAFDGTDGADGHEDGSMDVAMVCRNQSAACGTERIGGGLDKFHRSLDFNLLR